MNSGSIGAAVFAILFTIATAGALAIGNVTAAAVTATGLVLCVISSQLAEIAKLLRERE